ncbi:MAG TPA: hypothetical protein VFC39_14580 [Acidobacteriaceae bacterium]|nr:hypothetical protein [Acidobacteriaceae bacterium]
MSLVLDRATEDRIQRQLDRGPYAAPAELINRALDLLESENDLLARREEIAAKLQRCFDQSERGETYSPEEARAILTERRATRAAR